MRLIRNFINKVYNIIELKRKKINYSKITIEDDAYVGNSCTIIDTDFHDIKYEERIACGKGVAKEVLIKKALG